MNPVESKLREATQREKTPCYTSEWVVLVVKGADEIARLEAAIRKHRDYRGDHRCHLDDAELYTTALPEGDTRPEKETAVTIENCQRFIDCRQKGREYISPQVRIEELEAALAAREAEIDGLLTSLKDFSRLDDGLEWGGCDLTLTVTELRVTQAAMKRAVRIVAAVEQRRKIDEDGRNRTPDSELSKYELEDHPDELAKNTVRAAVEQRRRESKP